ncbi:MAG TPA: ornithine cyclodeaminase family protein [Terriglobales bacterium]|nr:ornithine cyclodeaminase family protein [Terriglobales bacterium]
MSAPVPVLSAAAAAPCPSPSARLLFLDQAAMLAAGVLDMPAAMQAVAAALVEWEQGRARLGPKVVLRAGDDSRSEQQWRINGLCAALGEPARWLGMKWIASFPPNRRQGLPRASGLLVLNSADTGLPLAVMDATLLSAMRTGAITGLGVKLLAPAQARRAAIVGAGVQARTQALGLTTACPQLEEIAIVARRPEAAAACVADCLRHWQLPVCVGSRQDLPQADIVVTATTAESPVLSADEVKPGALTVQIAGHECSFELVAACDKIVCDDWETVKHRGLPTPARMHAAGLLGDARIHANLPQLLTGARPGRESEQERIHFAHIGLGLGDVAWGAAVYQQAQQRRLGQRLELWHAPLWA